MLRGDGAVPVLPLAHGDLSDGDAAELRELKSRIQERVGLYCDGYKEKCLRRRIAVRMRARGVHTYGAYQRLLEQDPAEYQRLLDAITINVSKFFRNAELWTVLREQVVPALFARPEPELRVWSAGTAGGEEAYSLAMLVVEHAERTGDDPARVRILGTDIDEASLGVARRAEYGAFSFTETTPDVIERWFERGPPHRVRADVRALVEFATLDLMADPFPEGQHLILCRNVIIYFERAAQERLFAGFRDALVPGGLLVLGKVEALFGPAAQGFRTLAARERVFRRV
jgi:chemotaxis protein methyltransferase CheR